VQEAEKKVSVIRENLRAAQMRQKSYHDKARAPREFEVGNYVYLKVSPTKGVQRFRVKGKLAPRYIGLYEVTEKLVRLLIVFDFPTNYLQCTTCFTSRN
jgi:hypothetical protein